MSANPFPNFALLAEHATSALGFIPCDQLKKIESAFLTGAEEKAVQKLAQVEQFHSFEPVEYTIKSVENIKRKGDQDFFDSQRFTLEQIDTLENRNLVAHFKQTIQQKLQDRCAPNTAHFARDINICNGTAESFFLLFWPYKYDAVVRNTLPKVRIQGQFLKSRKISVRFDKDKKKNFPGLQVDAWHKWRMVLKNGEERYIDIRKMTMSYNFYTNAVTVSVNYNVWANGEHGFLKAM